MSIVLMPEALRSTLGEQAAKELVELFNNNNNSVKDSILETASDRFERRLSEFKGEVKADISAFRGEVKADISAVRADMIKWMFIFWISQIAVVTGILAYLK